MAEYSFVKSTKLVLKETKAKSWVLQLRREPPQFFSDALHPRESGGIRGAESRLRGLPGFALTLSGLDGGRTAVRGACAERGSLPRGRHWKQDRWAGDPWPRTYEFGSAEASLQASACKKRKDKKRGS
ncbi:uncharacterized protein [Gorilla gorilla gorilla]|uniref:uncharacterized protein isoform X2 n=1 Tax=Gorilla gorilla gorilla TaxID=9595 RepID=UPI002445C7E5|nr:uncharacterized protein LOC115933219 isoform X1 [Gorilla gorilla gorilla]XP_055229558.1 uncharacterized protein LOC115933219 isoform X1 [Gorilla gorilla gorilla]